MQNQPLIGEDAMAMRFTRLRKAAAAFDAERVHEIATEKFRAVSASTLAEQTAMRNGDRIDAEQIATVEENNDRVEHGTRARYRRAFVGVDLADVLDDEETLRVLHAIRRTDWDCLRDALTPTPPRR